MCEFSDSDCDVSCDVDDAVDASADVGAIDVGELEEDVSDSSEDGGDALDFDSLPVLDEDVDEGLDAFAYSGPTELELEEDWSDRGEIESATPPEYSELDNMIAELEVQRMAEATDAPDDDAPYKVLVKRR